VGPVGTLEKVRWALVDRKKPWDELGLFAFYGTLINSVRSLLGYVPASELLFSSLVIYKRNLRRPNVRLPFRIGDFDLT
jgi:hypothetical protein